jgi:prevent-host-death family protein
MSTPWQLQVAKNKLSEVVDLAIKTGPQEITRHGQKAAIVLSMREYQRLKQRKGSLADFLRQSPLAEIDLRRRKDTSREVDL